MKFIRTNWVKKCSWCGENPRIIDIYCSPECKKKDFEHRIKEREKQFKENQLKIKK